MEFLKQIRFTIPGEVKGKQRPKFARVGNYTKTYTQKETVQYENYVRLMFQQEAKGKRFSDDAMLDVRILAYFKIPKSTSKKKRGLMIEGRMRPTKKPDGDNIAKVVCDSLNEIAYHDDSAVVDMQVRKFYSEEPGLVVVIKDIS